MEPCLPGLHSCSFPHDAPLQLGPPVHCPAHGLAGWTHKSLAATSIAELSDAVVRCAKL